MFYAKGLKTGVMDIPLMVAKCLYEVPNLYGENIRNNKKNNRQEKWWGWCWKGVSENPQSSKGTVDTLRS